jgi:hypothetical protein
MHRIQWSTNPEDPETVILPCDYFDLIGGTDTGGLDAHVCFSHGVNLLYHRLITLLLVKCRMSVDEALDVFYDICETVYVDTTIDAAERSGRLRRYLEDTLRRKGLPIDLKIGRDDRVAETPKCAGYGPSLSCEILLIYQIIIEGSLSQLQKRPWARLFFERTLYVLTQASISHSWMLLSPPALLSHRFFL